MARITRASANEVIADGWWDRPEWVWHVFTGGSPQRLPPEPGYVVAHNRLRAWAREREALMRARDMLRRAERRLERDDIERGALRRVKERVRRLLGEHHDHHHL